MLWSHWGRNAKNESVHMILLVFSRISSRSSQNPSFHPHIWPVFLGLFCFFFLILENVVVALWLYANESILLFNLAFKSLMSILSWEIYPYHHYITLSCKAAEIHCTSLWLEILFVICIKPNTYADMHHGMRQIPKNFLMHHVPYFENSSPAGLPC